MTKRGSFRASFLVPTLSIVAALLGGAGMPSVDAATRHTPAPTTSAKSEQTVEPQAKDALTRMAAYLKSLPSFAVRQEAARDQVINGDLKVQKSSASDIVARKPDRLKVDTVADESDKSHSIFYDGKTLTIYYPATKYFAQMDAPGTIAETIGTVESRYGTDFPLADFLIEASGPGLTSDLTGAGYVGKSRAGGVETEHYVYRTKDVDYQLWIQSGDKPLLRKIVITSKKEAHHPQFTATLAWDLSPKTDDARFVFAQPPGATQIPFGLPPGATPPVKAPTSRQPKTK
jgi:hypothetical protein